MKIKGFILFTILALTGISIAETWRLNSEQSWQAVKSGGDSAFMMAAVEAKRLVSTGRVAKAQKAFDQLKQDYPELAGDDFDAFVEAELLYGRNKYSAAALAYTKFMDQFPQSSFYRAALQRSHQIATAFLGGQKRTVLGLFKVKAYEDGSEIMHGIADRAGDGPEAKKALVALAVGNEKRGANYQAYQSWAVIADKWPTGQIGRDALLGMARSLEQDYKGPRYDSKVLESSKSYYTEYNSRYPDLAAEIDVPQKLDQIDARLVQKELAIADYYARTGSDVAAGIYYQRIIDDWPASKASEDAQKKMAALKEAMAKKAQAQQKKKFSWKGLFL